MLGVRNNHRRLVVTLLVVLLLGAFLAVGLPGTAESTGYGSVRGMACFAKGDTESTYALGYNLTKFDAVVATLMGYAGKNVVVRNVKRLFKSDKIVVYLTAPATRDVCAAFIIWEMNTLG